MALIPDEQINKIIEANDLVSIAADVCPDLKQRGGKFLACCPFHKEKTPSFQIDQNLQLWHCFGCGEGGNIVTFVEKAYDYNFVESMEFLAEKANITLQWSNNAKSISPSKKSNLQEACNEAANFFHLQLTKSKSTDAAKARQYLGSRAMGSDVAKRWNLGYAPRNNQLLKYLMSKKFNIGILLEANLCIKDNYGKAKDRFYNRVMFPIYDANNNVIAFGGRIIGDGQPKYLNSSENYLFHKSKVLFGLNKAKSSMTSTGCAIVVEGYTDVIAMHEAGIKFAVATLGTALTRQHIRLLNQHAKRKIIYLFDGDEAGQRAAERALNFIDNMDRPEVNTQRAQLMALTLPENLDPKEFIDKYGKDKLLSLLNNAEPLIEYGIKRKISNFDLSIPGNKSKAALSAINVLAPIKDSLIAKEYLSYIADITGMRIEFLIDALNKVKPIATYSEANHKRMAVTRNDIYIGENKLEWELLCLFVKYSSNLREQIINCDYQWASDACKSTHQHIKNYVLTNQDISFHLLLLYINSKNKKIANYLTKMSNASQDINDPKKFYMFLVCKLKNEQIKVAISQKKQMYKDMDDETKKFEIFEDIVNLQKKYISNKEKLGLYI